MRNRCLILLLLLCLPAWQVIDTSATEVKLYDLFTLRVEVASELYADPFDKSDIELVAVFRSPSGAQTVVSGFWIQPYSSTYAPAGEPEWQVRFAPSETGVWSYTIQTLDNGSVVGVEEGSFRAVDSDLAGYIEVGPNDRYFQHSNGSPFFPVGLNLNWSWDGAGGIDTYLRWLGDIKASGGNYARLIIDVPWFINLDWVGPAGDYRAAQENAAKLDAVVASAADHGIFLQLVLLWHQSILISNGPPVLIPEQPARPAMTMDWDNHPYNIVNGGPLNGPGVFLYNPQARNLFQRRLDYIVARWGYSPHIFAWELIDRIDRISNYTVDTAQEWIQVMSGYLRRIDANRHLITFGSLNFDETLAASPYIDFASVQFYQRRPIETITDQTLGVLNAIQRQNALNPIPVLMTGFSLNPWFEPTADDPDGIHFQNSLWATALGGAAGGAMSDWWDTYIFPQDLDRYYAPLTAFSANIDWAGLDLQPAQASLLLEDTTGYLPLRLSEFDRRFGEPIRAVVRREVSADNVYPALNQVSSYLYGQVFNNQFSQAQLYQVVVPVDTYLEAGVRAVSATAGARLVMQIDRESAFELNLRADTRDTAVRIPLSAGEHQIVLDNLGDDWLELSYLEIGHLITPVRALTLRDEQAGVALAWLQHRDHTWENRNTPRNTIALRYQLHRMPAGKYVVEIWNPLTGGIVGEEVVHVDESTVLDVDLLPFDRLLALRIFRQEQDDEQDAEVTATAAPTRVPLVAQTNTPRP